MITKQELESILFVLMLVFVFCSLFTTVTSESPHRRVYQGLFAGLAVVAFGAMGLVAGF